MENFRLRRRLDLTVTQAVAAPLRSQACVSSVGCEAVEKSCPYKLLLERNWQRFPQRYLVHTGVESRAKD